MEVKQQSSPWAAAVPALLSFFAILALILDAETAVSAASAGLQLCLQTVVPSLFPFLVAARLFTSSGAVEWCARVVGPVMGPALCRVSSDLHEWRNDFPTVSTRSSAKLQYE